MAFREHPLRRQVVGEMHLRRWPHVEAPARVFQWIRLPTPAERAAELAELRQKAGAPTPNGEAPRHIGGTLAPHVDFVWEGHSEASSLAVFDSRPGAADDRMAADPDLAAILHWAEAMPGAVIRATRIDVVPTDADAAPLVAALGFEPAELISCLIGGSARLWSDFRVGPEGYGRLVVAANGMGSHDLSRTLKRLQELGNYRNLALLGLPAARDAWPALNAIEERLCTLGDHVRDTALADDALLEELSAVSVELVSIATSVNYRMSATTAYARLVEERLEDLGVAELPGYQSLADFTQRRFLPAVRTCAALTERERQLSGRAAQLSALLRARIESRIEAQNSAMLRSMERSIATQLRMQELVEGLSVVALAYYAIGLSHYLLGGLHEVWPGFDEDLTTALMVPLFLVGMWGLVRRLKGRLLGHGDSA